MVVLGGAGTGRRCLPGPAKGDRAACGRCTYDAVAQEIANILTSPDRLALPLQRIRPALTAHYVGQWRRDLLGGHGAHDAIHPAHRKRRGRWTQSGRLSHPTCWSKCAMRSTTSDPRSAARAELYFSAFFVTYAADLKIGRVDPAESRSADFPLAQDRRCVPHPEAISRSSAIRRKFLAAFEPKNPHYRLLKKTLVALPREGARRRLGRGGAGRR